MVIPGSRFLWAPLICLTLSFGISPTKVESSERLASDLTLPADSKKVMVVAAGESSGPAAEKPVIGATQPPSPLSWDIRADLLILHREKIDDVTFPVKTNYREHTKTLNAEDLTLGFGYGLDASLGVKLRTSGTTLGAEVRYFGIKEWSEEGSFISQTISWAAPAPDAYGTYDVTTDYDYTSNLHNVEINLNWYPIERIRVLVGGRYIYIDEELKYANVRSRDLSIAKEISAKNNLLGVQVGIDGIFLGKTDDGISIDGLAKVGYFNNHISARANANTVIGSESIRFNKDEGTLGAEFGIGVKYAFSRNIAFSAGYQLLWLDKVALAPQQGTMINYDEGSTVETESVLYQGGWIGFIFSW